MKEHVGVRFLIQPEGDDSATFIYRPPPEKAALEKEGLEDCESCKVYKEWGCECYFCEFLKRKKQRGLDEVD